ncbi:phosphocholine cytidylyltransferase family protein [Tahibacter amnicola]|uniref:Phosphocholine cytidylyltransferase family protein n=1 Tax=Tahibacter amnicola TaxID=2976241 RepID=A0ABY6BD96_9GAMM|nr:phosphocholine cytidylyltransferase family protein [Tahibacter amnicola]UXI67829.1 phosphocholine cytidylyltransferase family protein [Tahibacter amnicola]
MQAVILAAGRGSRLGQLTRRRPKAALRLAGRRLIDWQCAALEAAGIDAIRAVAGHAGEALHAPTGVHVFHNADWSTSGPVASLLCGLPDTPRQPVLMAYGDGVFHPDLARALRHSDADIAITVDLRWHALWSRRFTDVLADAETLKVDAGQLVAIGARPAHVDDVQAQFTGLLRLSPSGWKIVQDFVGGLCVVRRASLDTTSLLSALLAEGVAIEAIPVEGRWCEVDSARDLALYRLLARRTPGWSHDWRWRHPS